MLKKEKRSQQRQSFLDYWVHWSYTHFFSHIFAILSKENCSLIGLYPSYIIWCCLLFRCNKMCYINLTSWWLQYFLGKKKKKSLFYLVHGVLLEFFSLFKIMFTFCLWFSKRSDFPSWSHRILPEKIIMFCWDVDPITFPGKRAATLDDCRCKGNLAFQNCARCFETRWLRNQYMTEILLLLQPGHWPTVLALKVRITGSVSQFLLNIKVCPDHTAPCLNEEPSDHNDPLMGIVQQQNTKVLI